MERYCPESVGLALFEKILEQDDQTKTNQPAAARLLDLFSECIRAVNGDRVAPDLGMMH
jgi:hypothetical protein